MIFSPSSSVKKRTGRPGFVISLRSRRGFLNIFNKNEKKTVSSAVPLAPRDGKCYNIM